MSVLDYVDQDRQFIEWEMNDRRKPFYPPESDGVPASPTTPDMARYVFKKPVDYRIFSLGGSYRLTSPNGYGPWIMTMQNLRYDGTADVLCGEYEVRIDGPYPTSVNYRVTIMEREGRLECTFFEVTADGAVLPIGHARV